MIWNLIMNNNFFTFRKIKVKSYWGLSSPPYFFYKKINFEERNNLLKEKKS